MRYLPECVQGTHRVAVLSRILPRLLAAAIDYSEVSLVLAEMCGVQPRFQHADPLGQQVYPVQEREDQQASRGPPRHQADERHLRRG